MNPARLSVADVLAGLRAHPWRCKFCHTPLDLGPGVCKPCGTSEDLKTRREALYGAAMSIPERFRWATPDSHELPRRVRFKFGSPDALRALAAAPTPVVVCQGVGRSGKTSFVCAMAAAVLQAGEADTSNGAAFYRAKGLRFVSALDLDEPASVAQAIAATVLVLDDLGQDLGGANAGSGVLSQRVTGATSVIMKRHNTNRTTWITTPYDAKRIESLYGDGVSGRLLEEPNRWFAFGA